MIAFTWQTILLLVLAYFAGCIVGCLARKLKGAGPVVDRDGLAMAPAGAPRDSAPAAFVAPVPMPAAVRPVPVQDAFRRAERDVPGDQAEPAPPPRAPRQDEQPAPAPPGPPVIPPPESAVVAVATALAAAPPAAPAAPDDLTRIRAVDGTIEAALNRAGVTRYAEIAAWTSEQVKAISQHLGFDGRIERENWIEQAHILARGEETDYATRRAIVAAMPPAPVPAAPIPAPPASVATAPDVASRAAFAEPRREVPSPAPMPAPAAATTDRESLQRIGGITAEIEKALFTNAVTRYSQIAGWSADDVERVERLLGCSGRVSRENWIEQAQILANGGATAYSREFDRHGGPPVAPITPDVPPDLSGMVSVRSEAYRAADSVAARPPKARDDLKRIRGIGVALETRLNAIGVTSYAQIAGWTAPDVANVSGKLGLDRAIERENWIEQAHILARGGVTAYARAQDRSPLSAIATAPPPASPVPGPAAVMPAAIRVPVAADPPAEVATPAIEPPPAAVPAADLSGMRSVRSPAYRGDDSLAAPPRDAAPDDLKRIRGIGVLLERKLNAMGVTTYEQIANWTADDVGTVNTKLEFKGRIERENWIEQARILASGGHTDFSRRFERGEV